MDISLDTSTKFVYPNGVVQIPTIKSPVLSTISSSSSLLSSRSNNNNKANDSIESKKRLSNTANQILNNLYNSCCSPPCNKSNLNTMYKYNNIIL